MGNINLGFTEGRGKNCVYTTTTNDKGEEERVVDEKCAGKVAKYDQNVMLHSATADETNDPSCVVNNYQLNKSYIDFSIYEDLQMEANSSSTLVSLLFLFALYPTIKHHNIISIGCTLSKIILGIDSDEDYTFKKMSELNSNSNLDGYGYKCPLKIKKQYMPVNTIYQPIYVWREIKDDDDLTRYVIEPTRYYMTVLDSVYIVGLPEKWSMMRCGRNDEYHIDEDGFTCSCIYMCLNNDLTDINTFKFDIADNK